MVDELTEESYRVGKAVVEVSVDILKMLAEAISKAQQNRNMTAEQKDSLLKRVVDKVASNYKETHATLKGFNREGKEVSHLDVSDEKVAEILKNECKKNRIPVVFREVQRADGTKSYTAFCEVKNVDQVASLLRSSTERVLEEQKAVTKTLTLFNDKNEPVFTQDFVKDLDIDYGRLEQTGMDAVRYEIMDCNRNVLDTGAIGATETVSALKRNVMDQAREEEKAAVKTLTLYDENSKSVFKQDFFEGEKIDFGKLEKAGAGAVGYEITTGDGHLIMDGDISEKDKQSELTNKIRQQIEAFSGSDAEMFVDEEKESGGMSDGKNTITIYNDKEEAVFTYEFSNASDIDFEKLEQAAADAVYSKGEATRDAHVFGKDLEKAGMIALEKQSVSVAQLQKELGIGQNQALSIVKKLEEMGVVSKEEKGRHKTVMDKENFINYVMPVAQNKNLVDISLTKQIVAEETDRGYKTRVPGTWGENVRYLWIEKENATDIHKGKSILSFLDKDKEYKLYSEQGKAVETIKGSDLYNKHYDKVSPDVRDKAEGRKTKKKTERDEKKSRADNPTQKNKEEKSEQPRNARYNITDNKGNVLDGGTIGEKDLRSSFRNRMQEETAELTSEKELSRVIVVYNSRDEPIASQAFEEGANIDFSSLEKAGVDGVRYEITDGNEKTLAKGSIAKGDYRTVMRDKVQRDAQKHNPVPKKTLHERIQSKVQQAEKQDKNRQREKTKQKNRSAEKDR